MKEYAFDVQLKAVVRVKARNERAARDAMDEILEACEPSPYLLEGYNDAVRGADAIQVTEVSLTGRHPNLFEIDGKAAKSRRNCEHRETAGGICLDCGHDIIDDEY